VHLVKSMMDLYDCFDPDILDEARKAFKAPWYQAYGVKNLGYVDVETEAAEVNQFLPVEVPGLLQVEAYMRALFSTGPCRSAKELDNDVIVRLIRARRLADEERPLGLVAIVYEAALHRRIGGPMVMREQLQHLIEMTRLPTVTLQVLPLAEGAHYVPNGSFNLMRFPDPEDPELLYVEYPTGALHIEKPAPVREARVMFEQLRTVAMSPIDSVALIERLATELHGS
jgi:hypothetical protein